MKKHKYDKDSLFIDCALCFCCMICLLVILTEMIGFYREGKDMSGIQLFNIIWVSSVSLIILFWKTPRLWLLAKQWTRRLLVRKFRRMYARRNSEYLKKKLDKTERYESWTAVVGLDFYYGIKADVLFGILSERDDEEI